VRAAVSVVADAVAFVFILAVLYAFLIVMSPIVP
jgi:hypothetical protein